MTKVSVFGQQPTEAKELKKIEFVKYVNGDLLTISCPSKDPKEWENVCLIEKYYAGYDAILAAHNNGVGCAYLGHWNDGVV